MVLIRLTWYCGTCDFEDVHEEDAAPPLFGSRTPLNERPALECPLCGKRMRLRRRARFYTY